MRPGLIALLVLAAVLPVWPQPLGTTMRRARTDGIKAMRLFLRGPEGVDAKHRVHLYGRFDTIGIVQSVRGGPLGLGSALDPLDDLLNGVPVVAGQGFTQRGLLGVNFWLSPSFRAGAELSSYVSVGSSAVNVYWGAQAPWVVNVWSELGSPSPTLSPPASPPYLRMVADNLWLSHPQSDSRLTAGTFQTRYVGRYIFEGLPNPAFLGDPILPLYGLDLRGGKGTPGPRFELLYSDMPDATAYKTRSFGGTARWEFSRDSGVGFNLMQTHNMNPFGAPVALTTLQALPFNLPLDDPSIDKFFAAWRGLDGRPQFFVGPQAETNVGGDLTLLLAKRLHVVLRVEYAHSVYNPDTSGTLFSTSVGGSLLRCGVAVRPFTGLDLEARWLSVDPTYDPFVIDIPRPPGVALFVPATGQPLTTSQLHNTVDYPNNRRGIDLRARWQSADRRDLLTVSYSDYQQVKATTIDQALSVGYVDPQFSPLLGGGSERGRAPTFKAVFEHEWAKARLFMRLTYERTNLVRGGDEFDSMDLPQTTWRILLRHPIDDRLTVRAGWALIDWRGHNGLLPIGTSEEIPEAGLDYRLSQKSTLSVEYRLMYLTDHSGFDLGSATGSQLRVEMKNEF